MLDGGRRNRLFDVTANAVFHRAGGSRQLDGHTDIVAVDFVRGDHVESDQVLAQIRILDSTKSVENDIWRKWHDGS